MLAVLSPHTVGVFYLVAAILLSVGAVVTALMEKAIVSTLLLAGLAFYVWPQAINALS